MALALPWGAPLTYDDVQRFPADGHRYELVEGVLLVTPGPNAEHQSVVMNLSFALRRPPEMSTLSFPRRSTST